MALRSGGWKGSMELEAEELTVSALFRNKNASSGETKVTTTTTATKKRIADGDRNMAIVVEIFRSTDQFVHVQRTGPYRTLQCDLC